MSESSAVAPQGQHFATRRFARKLRQCSEKCARFGQTRHHGCDDKGFDGMASNSRQAFNARKADIDHLWRIHTEMAGQGKGRKYDVEVLNRAAIVFVADCWEAFV